MTNAEQQPQSVGNRQQPRDDEFLTKEEIAQRLKKDRRTVDNWMRRGILPYYKIGRTVAFRWSDVVKHFEVHFRVIEGRGR